MDSALVRVLITKSGPSLAALAMLLYIDKSPPRRLAHIAEAILYKSGDGTVSADRRLFFQKWQSKCAWSVVTLPFSTLSCALVSPLRLY